jgi:hypothetical protein
MKKPILFSILLSTVIALFAISLQSARPNDGDDKKIKAADSLIKVLEALKPSFDCRQDKQGYLQLGKEELNQLLKKKLCILSTANTKSATIRGFDLQYCEKGVFEDSTGVPSIITECNLNSFNGDSIPQMWLKAFEERLYKGDSLVFDNFVVNYDSKTYRIKNKLVVSVTH